MKIIVGGKTCRKWYHGSMQKRKMSRYFNHFRRSANVSIPAGEDYVFSKDPPWRNKKELKETKPNQMIMQRPKRSKARTIISLNTNHTIEIV